MRTVPAAESPAAVVREEDRTRRRRHVAAPAFRPDVEGLRAVAVVLVVLAHAGVPLVRGGYIGVDVFFVISGFLITRLLAGELERSGRISLPRFYARRIKRLMPQAVTAIVCVAAASALLLPPVRAEAVAHDVMAAGGYVMNVHLSAEAVDYFAQGAADGPLDHFWSLSVEEQYYVVWPLVLLGLAAVARRARRVVVGRAIAAALAALAAASLLHAVHWVHVEPAGAYFDTLGRIWELALGGLLAVALSTRRLPAAVARAAAWTGLGALAVAALEFDAGTAVPGLPALLPTLGTVALIAAGTSTAASVPTRVLSTRPMQYVGRLSYAWYVWHWPVLVFAAVALGPLSPSTGVLVAGASLVPAVLTHHLMEEPMRRSTLHARRPRVVLIAAPAGILAALCAAALLVAALPSTPSLARDRALGAAALEHSTKLERRARAVVPTPLKADRDRGRPVDDGCIVDGNTTWSSRCMYADKRSKTTVVLFGDSHAFQYFSPVERIAQRRHWRLVELTKQGCPPADVLVYATFLGRAYPECTKWQRSALRTLRSKRPDMLIVAGSAHYGVIQDGQRLAGDANRAALDAGYAHMLGRLGSVTRRVVFIADSPRPPQYIPDCVAEALHHLHRCAFARDAAVAASAGVRNAVAAVPDVKVVDPTPEYCPRALCPAVIGDVLVYRNSGHVTDTYTRTMTPWLGRRIPHLKG